MTSRASIIICVVVCIVGPARASKQNLLPADAKRVLDNPSSMTLLSLDPVLRSPNIFARLTDHLPHRRFHGWGVLGQTNIEDPSVRKQIATSLERAVRDFDGSIAECFNPRHALRVASGTETYDFVICYQCSSVEIYEGDKRLHRISLTGSSRQLDRLLKAANIELTKN